MSDTRGFKFRFHHQLGDLGRGPSLWSEMSGGGTGLTNWEEMTWWHDIYASGQDDICHTGCMPKP